MIYYAMFASIIQFEVKVWGGNKNQKYFKLQKNDLRITVFSSPRTSYRHFQKDTNVNTTITYIFKFLMFVLMNMEQLEGKQHAHDY